MLSSIDFSGRPFHFIGIGGIGMSALAYILAKRQLPVYGSDIRASHITQRLQENGAHIFWCQDASNFDCFQRADVSVVPEKVTTSVNGKSLKTTTSALENAVTFKQAENKQLPQVICSTAIQTANAEYLEALKLGCPIFHRSDLLAALIQDYQSIAVAGTHGKTTTSSLIGYMLLKAGLDPTIVVGGEVGAWEGNARLGESPYLVAEADESDGSLVKLAAKIGVITNVELDHPDHYQTLDEVIATFQVFQQQCETLIACIDCATVKAELNPTISYSLQISSGADYTVDCVSYSAEGTTARVWERGTSLGYVSLKLLGRHNLSNALAAIAVGRELGLEFSVIAEAIASFEGARRRFEVRGQHHNILLVDDYAHHPSEIRVTLNAGRLRLKTQQSGFEVNVEQQAQSPQPAPVNGRVVAIFQPHRYSRTLKFLDEFAQSFEDADLVVVSDIYSAGEPDLGQINGQKMADLIATYHPQVCYKPSLAAISTFLKETLKPGDIALFLGAGNLNQVIPELVAFYQTAHFNEPTQLCH